MAENDEKKYKEQKSRETLGDAQVSKNGYVRTDKIVEIDDAVKFDIRHGYFRDTDFVYTAKGIRFDGKIVKDVALALVKGMSKEDLESLKAEIAKL